MAPQGGSMHQDCPRRGRAIRLQLAAAALALSFGGFACAAVPPATPTSISVEGDIPAAFTPPTAQNDYVRRVDMIPMRDGVKLYTVIVIPKGARDAPILLTRTPYNANQRGQRNDSPSMVARLPLADEDFAEAGYIRVYQDVRGKHGSEGAYEMMRPLRGPLNPTDTDESTDAYDTIDWLIHHLPESNQKVGIIGSSYDGFETAMALINPHPALKAAAPESPIIDGWMGDDWFHYGAFRLFMFDYITKQTELRGTASDVPRPAYDDFDTFLKAGSAEDYAKTNGLDQLSYWRKLLAHTAYDGFWQGQALDQILAAHPSNVPTLWEQGLWDQEDIWGADHAFLALKAAGHEANNWLVMGPWSHSQANREGGALGPFKWTGDTARQFRRDMLLPFFNQYLRGGPPADLARATIYNPADNRWERFDDWPGACPAGCARPMTPLYLQAGLGLGFDKPKTAEPGDSFVSDPAKPVPFLPRPTQFVEDGDAWRTWLLHDQRFVDGRPDVLTYQTPPLTAEVKIKGAPVADIIAATTGTDGDIVVRLIDVFPPLYPDQPELGGYELPVSLDIFRGRYRESFDHPSAIPPNTPQRYRFTLPSQNYVFKPGHRIMVQIQATLFPLYDRNPQTFVANPMLAAAKDYQKATVTILHSDRDSSAIWLPIAP